MKTACEKFREYLEWLSKEAHKYEKETGEKFYEHPGEILQVFDELHQSSRENTGDKCKGKREEEEAYTCAICNSKCLDYRPIYPGQICPDCENKAVDESGLKPWNDSWKDDGSNPVFVEGVKCHRRYKFGGWKTMTYDGWKEYRKRFTTINWSD